MTPDVAERLEAFNHDAVNEFFTPAKVELMDTHGLRDWIARTYFVAGTHEQVVRRMRAFVEAGATDVRVPRFVPHSTADVPDVLRSVGHCPVSS